jgi:hypothetical protein
LERDKKSNPEKIEKIYPVEEEWLADYIEDF